MPTITTDAVEIDVDGEGHDMDHYADDPTRREELVRLLNSFDSTPAGPGAMSPARLRAALRL